MFRKKINYYSILLASGDFFILTGSFLLAYYGRFGHFIGFFDNQFLALLLFTLLAWTTCTVAFKLYQRFFYQDRLAQIGLWFRCFLVFAFLIIAFNGLIKTYFSRLLIIGMYASMAMFQVGWRLAFPNLAMSMASFKKNSRKAIIVGADQMSPFFDVFENMRLPDINIVGYFGDRFSIDYQHLGKTDDLFGFLKNPANGEEIDEIYCSLTALSVAEINKLIEIADNNLIKVFFVPDQKGIPFRKLNVDFFGHIPILSVRHLSIDEPFNRFIKRLFDLAFSFFVIVLLLSWLVPILAILIKIDSRGPVFFKQKRSGKNNRLFLCLKFRTMRENQDSDVKQAEKNDSRITRLGAFLRKTSLDELPQFFNVLLGDMSVIGPRPHMVSHTELYSKIVNKFMVRHWVKPGITGLSQAMGYRGETKEKNAMKNRVRLDIFYIENWSFWLDVKIVVLTIISLLKKQNNAY